MNFTPTASRIDQPKTYGVVSVDLVPIWRALSKVALNALCHLAGPDVARLPRFDGARRFVLEGTGEEHFVQWLEEDEPERHILSRFAEAGDHVLVLWVGMPTVVVLSLYGRPLAMIALDPDESGCAVKKPEDVSAAIVFNRSPRTHEVVRLRDDIIGFSHRFKMLPWRD